MYSVMWISNHEEYTVYGQKKQEVRIFKYLTGCRIFHEQEENRFKCLDNFTQFSEHIS
jgi:hypothetical protein